MRRPTDSVAMNQVGEPDAGNPHVRFDERGLETGGNLPRQLSTLLIRRVLPNASLFQRGVSLEMGP